MDSCIDPVTRDYVLSNGALLPDPADGLFNACYLRLETPQGSYWADKTLGSRLHELQRDKDTRRVAVLARQYAEQALAPLLADGRATQINVSTERMPGRLDLLLEVRASGGAVLTFRHPVPVI